MRIRVDSLKDKINKPLERLEMAKKTGLKWVNKIEKETLQPMPKNEKHYKELYK